MTINSINKNQEALNTPLKYYYRDGTEVTRYKIFPSDNPKSKRMYSHRECWLCNGTAYLPHYAHIDSGVCYKCMGHGTHKRQVWTKEQINKLEEKDKIKIEEFNKEQEKNRPAILKAQEEEKKQKQIAEEKRLADIEAKFEKMEYVGTIGEKIELEVRIVFSKTFDGYYGSSTIYSMEDSKGNSLVYWQSGYGNFPSIEKKEENGDLLMWNPAKEEKFLIKATVKDYKVYEREYGYGKVKQTILARPKTIRAVGEQHWQNIGTWK